MRKSKTQPNFLVNAEVQDDFNFELQAQLHSRKAPKCSEIWYIGAPTRFRPYGLGNHLWFAETIESTRTVMAIAPRNPDELLRDVPVLSELPAPDLIALSELAEVRKAARAAPLFQEGQPAEGLFIVRTGEVKLVKSGKDGREQILYLARPGRPITEGIRFDGGAYPASAVAMRAASALLITNEALLSLGDRKPAIMRAIVDLRARRVDRLLALVSDLSLRTVPARLASFLCTLAAQRDARGDESKTLVRDLTTETVAGRLGTVREEISRGLALLEREGALKVSPDVIVIEDLARLEAIAYGSRRG